MSGQQTALAAVVSEQKTALAAVMSGQQTALAAVMSEQKAMMSGQQTALAAHQTALAAVFSGQQTAFMNGHAALLGGHDSPSSNDMFRNPFEGMSETPPNSPLAELEAPTDGMDNLSINHFES
jgi:hypothetical protein